MKLTRGIYTENQRGSYETLSVEADTGSSQNEVVITVGRRKIVVGVDRLRRLCDEFTAARQAVRAVVGVRS